MDFGALEEAKFDLPNIPDESKSALENDDSDELASNESEEMFGNLRESDQEAIDDSENRATTRHTLIDDSDFAKEAPKLVVKQQEIWEEGALLSSLSPHLEAVCRTIKTSLQDKKHPIN